MRTWLWEEAFAKVFFYDRMFWCCDARVVRVNGCILQAWDADQPWSVLIDVEGQLFFLTPPHAWYFTALSEKSRWGNSG